MNQLWRVNAKHFVAGIVVSSKGLILFCPPILKWAEFKELEWFKGYCLKKGWGIENCSERTVL